MPRDTRPRLIAALKALENKRDKNPPRSTAIFRCELVSGSRARPTVRRAAGRDLDAVRSQRAAPSVDVQAHPDRQPRRDRRARDPRLPRARHRSRSPSIPRPTAPRCTCARPTTRTPSARRPPRESYLETDTILAAAHADRRRRHPSRLRLPLRERRLRAARARTPASCSSARRPTRSIAMGDKVEARKLMAAAGVPVVPGSPGHARPDEAEVARGRRARSAIPVMLKAAAGGGGKGMRLVEQENELASAMRAVAQRGASRPSATAASTSRSSCAARATSRSRSWPTRTGNTVHLFERECSIQRRHQKVVEESPSPFITPEMRHAMGEVAVQGGAGGQLRRRRHDRVPGRRRPELLLPRDEHPHPGRAPDHRDGDRHRPGARRRSRSPPARRCRSASRTDASAAGRSSAASTPRIPATGFLPAPGKIDTLRCAERARRAQRLPASTRAPRSRCTTIR